MEFMQGRARCCEEEEEDQEEEIIGNMGKLPFNSSSSCSSSPSSSHQFQAIFPPPPHHHQMISQPWGAQTCDKINSSTTSSSTQLQPWPSEPDQAAESSCDPADPTNFNGCCDPLQRKPELGGTRPESDNGDGGGGNGSSSRTDHPCICIEREHMFDKVVTPSDVGKLNRLVIPKQHAEKYFPLDSTTNEKGLLLNFEDRNGKPWRFRYSYWNSSQSYVMTKGWSRFVKEKKLYAGDIVSFERGAGELGKDRLYINWRRRPDRVALPPLHQIPLPQSVPFGQIFLPSSTVPVSMPRDQYVHHRVPQELNYEHQYLHHHHHHHHHGTTYGYNVMNPGSSAGSVLYLRSSSSSSTTTSTTPYHHQGSTDQDQMPIVFESVPVVHGKAAAVKRLRLFGVNVECPISEDEVLSSTTFVPHTTMASSSLIISPHHRHHHHQISSSSSSSLSYHPLQLRLYNGGPVVPAAATVPSELPRNNIRAQPSMSLDFGHLIYHLQKLHNIYK